MVLKQLLLYKEPLTWVVQCVAGRLSNTPSIIYIIFYASGPTCSEIRSIKYAVNGKLQFYIRMNLFYLIVLKLQKIRTLGGRMQSGKKRYPKKRENQISTIIFSWQSLFWISISITSGLSREPTSKHSSNASLSPPYLKRRSSTDNHHHHVLSSFWFGIVAGILDVDDDDDDNGIFDPINPVASSHSKPKTSNHNHNNISCLLGS